jgi:hypothetical protein
VRRVDQQPFLGVPGVLGADAAVVPDLHHLGGATHLHLQAAQHKRHAGGAALEADRAVTLHWARHRHVERLGQDRHRPQQPLLGLPGGVHGQPRRGATPPSLPGTQLLVGAGLQLGQAGERPDQARAALDETHPALDLPLVLRVAWQARIDVGAHGPGVSAVGVVDLAPRPGASGHAGLEVVDAEHGRDAAEAAQGLVVGVVPAQLVPVAAPDQHLLARVREHQHEGFGGLRPLADIQAGGVRHVKAGRQPYQEVGESDSPGSP